MLVRDIMTTEVITIPSKTSVIEAKRILDKTNLHRLPVVDKGKLVGIVTVRRLEEAAPPAILSRNMWDVAYSMVALHKIPVKQVMKTKLVTASPTTTVEEALALAQAKKVGGLVVCEKDKKVVGIVTTNDFFYRIVNKVLGVGEPGERLWIPAGGEAKAMEQILHVINELDLEVLTLHVIAPPRKKTKDIVVHLDTDNVDKLVESLKTQGFEVEVRKR
ncbi:MAG: CBS domain-containing protein [Dehalococcoidales bacterium]